MLDTMSVALLFPRTLTSSCLRSSSGRLPPFTTSLINHVQVSTTHDNNNDFVVDLYNWIFFQLPLIIFGHSSLLFHLETNRPFFSCLFLFHSFIGRRADSKFADTIVKRLRMSKINNAPISVSRLARYMKGKEDKTAVIVGTVTDDPRLLEIPGIKIAALRFTETARARIVKAGGECLTLDQLALRAPKGSNTVLLRGAKNARESVKYFGHRTSVNNPHTHDSVKPRVRSNGRKFERARGRRRSVGFKI